MHLLYSVLIYLYGFLFHIVAFFNNKAIKIVNGRKLYSRQTLKLNQDSECIWLHCASAGEMEQAIPIINAIRAKHKNYLIAVSFYSSSGFEQYCHTSYADYYFYFPLDTKKNALKIISTLEPKLAIFIRSEIWWNILSALKENKIPTYLVNANLKQKQNFLYQYYLEKNYPLFTKIFDTKNYGNTKIEQVLLNQRLDFKDERLAEFCKNSYVILLGSSWQKEEELMATFYKNNKAHFNNLKIMIAPHEWNDRKQNELVLLFGEAVNTYSSFDKNNIASILLLDKKGILKYAYRYADIAFIGGGFGKGVHNVSEAAVYGIPTIFGPKYDKFEEIIDLVIYEISFVVTDRTSFEEQLIELMNNASLRNSIKEKAAHYFDKQTDCAAKIISEILD